MKLSVVIVSYNSFKQLNICLDSIIREKIDDSEIILIDNSSSENGIDAITKKYKKIKIIRNTKNLGYAKAVNIGLKISTGEYALVLNPDTKIIPGTLKYCLKYLENHLYVGIISCGIYSEKGNLLKSAGYASPHLISHIYEYNYPIFKLVNFIFPNYNPTLYSLEKHKNELFVKHIIGVFLMIRKSIINTTGYFDERFFMYREETDFCKRTIDAGFKIAYLPKKGIIHIGAGSSKIKLTQASSYYMQSTYLFFRKQYGFITLLIAFVIGLFSSFTSIITLYIESLTDVHLKSEIKMWNKILDWHIKNLRMLSNF